MAARLKLKAEDAEDLGIFSAHLQDAVGRVGDITYIKSKRRFAAVFNRFMWEEAGRGDGEKRRPFHRVRAGLHFDGVLGVQAQRVRQSAPDAVIELLAIRFEPKEDGAGTITLVLAGGGAIKLDVECIDAELADLTEPWKARGGKPAHDEGGGAFS